MAFDRYRDFRVNNTPKTIPFIKLSKKQTDKEIEYKRGQMRMDLLSNKYYSDPNFGWLIMLANAKYGGLEFNIPDGAIITIPFPLEPTLIEYNTLTSEYIKHYGLV